MFHSRFQPRLGTLLLLTALALVLPACGSPHEPAIENRPPEYRAFGPPQRVSLRGYDDDAMEPFITRDGRFLLFNNRNDPRIDTRLLFAERIDDLNFDFRDEIGGANSPALEGVPSLDRHGNLFFVSTRSYPETLATLYQGRFDGGRVSDLRLAAGISLRQPGMVTFDAEISADGDSLFLADGRFSGGPMPESADIDIAVREGAGFRRLPSAGEILKLVNTRLLEYAPAVSDDLLELFFTRFDRAGGSAVPVILRAARPGVEAPFGTPERIASIGGHVEAPALSSDGRSLYYHKLEEGRFVIYRVAR